MGESSMCRTVPRSAAEMRSGPRKLKVGLKAERIVDPAPGLEVAESFKSAGSTDAGPVRHLRDRGGDLPHRLIDDVLDVLATRIADRVADRLSPHSTAPKLMTLQEAAAALRCSKSTVIRRIDAGELRTARSGRKGGRILIQEEDVLRLVDQTLTNAQIDDEPAEVARLFAEVKAS